MEISEHIKAILDTLPEKPGCYLMKDKDGKIIYVGKAINLKNRVRSYFHASADQTYKTQQMVRKIADIDLILVDSELEALILEMNLIKEHRPFYNVRLKDDKRYPYIKVHWADDFPKVSVTRQMVKTAHAIMVLTLRFGLCTKLWKCCGKYSLTSPVHAKLPVRMPAPVSITTSNCALVRVLALSIKNPTVR